MVEPSPGPVALFSNAFTTEKPIGRASPG